LDNVVEELGDDSALLRFHTSFKMRTQGRTKTPRDVAEAALAHAVKDKAEADYAGLDFFERREKLIARWVGFILTVGLDEQNVVRL
jgi:hypothetical protein